MTNLTRFENDGIELVINTQTGEAFATQAGYVRMSGKPKMTISDRVSKLVREGIIKEDEIDTGYGFKLVRCIPAKLVFKWLIKDNSELAEVMGEAGATVYLHQLAGYKVSSSAIAPAEQPKLASTVEETAARIDPLRRFLKSVPEPLVEGFLLNRLQAHHPELKADINAAHSLLAANTPIPEILLNPRAIGKRLGTSAQVINALLLANGYQTRNPNKAKGEPAYFPTEKGKPYSMNTIATGRGEDDTSYQHTKWKESMVEILRGLMKD
jgi:hypothetical protein